MANYATPLIGLVGAVIGAVLTAVLTPFVQGLYARRTKTLVLILNRDHISVPAARGGALNLQIVGRPVEQVCYRTFVLKNKTGRTLRDFRLEFEMHFPHAAIYRPVQFEFDESGAAIAFKDADSTEEKSVFNITCLDRNQSVSGRIISADVGKVRCRATQELEVRVVDRRVGPLGLMAAGLWGWPNA